MLRSSGLAHLSQSAPRCIINKVQYFVRTMEKHKESMKAFCPEVACSALGTAKDEAKRRVLEADPALMLQADACFRNKGEVRTKYRCWIDRQGIFHEYLLG